MTGSTIYEVLSNDGNYELLNKTINHTMLFFQKLQEELEDQQEHVNSLQNMVVVVDESNTDSGRYVPGYTKPVGLVYLYVRHVWQI